MTKFENVKDALQDAIDLANKIDEPKKVVIPQFVANWIEIVEAKYTEKPLQIVRIINDRVNGDTDYNFDWLQDDDNQKLLLDAIINGYEVEDE